MIGVATAIALAAALLFRGLRFWLPMLPGVWIWRRVTAAPGVAGIPEGPLEQVLER